MHKLTNMTAKKLFLYFTLLIFMACGSSDDSSDSSGDNGNNNGGNSGGNNNGGNDDTKDETNFYFSESGNDLSLIHISEPTRPY